MLLTLLAQPLHQLLETGELAPIAVAPALAQQAPERGLEVPAVKDVLAQTVEERVGVIAEWVLGAVPDAEAMLRSSPSTLQPRDIITRELTPPVSYSSPTRMRQVITRGSRVPLRVPVIRHRPRFRRVRSC